MITVRTTTVSYTHLLIHVKCKVRDLLSGIIMMTALWTINLYIAGTANVPLFSQETIFKNDFMKRVIPDSVSEYTTLLIVLVLAILCKVLLDLYLKTKSGFLLRAAGDNDTLVTSCLLYTSVQEYANQPSE